MSFRALFCLSAVLVLFGAVTTAQADVPQMINYQGILTSGGSPVTTEVNVIFAVWDAEIDGDSVWSEPRTVTPDGNGAFSILLGGVSSIGDGAFSGPDRWLSVQVESDPEMTPRVHLASVPYSHRISTVDGATGGTIYGDLNIEWGTGTQKAMGPGEHNFKVGSNIDLTAAEYTMAVGQNHVGASNNALIIGDADTVRGDYSMILGTYSAIGVANGAFIVGSLNRVEDGSDRSVVIGAINYAQGYDNICFGIQDSIKESHYSAILSGSRNKIIKGSNNSIISGGQNRISGSKFSTISGGERNRIDSTDNGDVAFINACIGGGADNIASSDGATISGGQVNEARGVQSTVGGGFTNKATNRHTTVAGGIFNQALGDAATVGGGQNCLADGNYGTVPGGWANRAGNNSFAAGINAKAQHDHSFAWNGAWDIDSFYTTGHQQFLINAPGGVGIGLNNPNPIYALEVAGAVDAEGFSINGAPVGTSSDSYWLQSGSDIYYNAGNVGIGTSTPGKKLEVSGDMKVTGVMTCGTGTVTIDGPNEKITLGTDDDSLMVIPQGVMVYELGVKRAEYGTPGGVFYNSSGIKVAEYGTPGGVFYDNVTGLKVAEYGTPGGVFYDTDGTTARVKIGGTNQNLELYNASGVKTAELGGATNGLTLSNSSGTNTALMRYYGFEMRNSSGNKTLNLNGSNGNITLHNSSGTEMLALTEEGIVYDSSGSSGALTMFSPGGTTIHSNLARSAGVTLAAGGNSWNPVSDRNRKENFEQIDSREVLEKVASFPISTWNFKSQDESIRHMGPMAQDLHAAFGLGIDDKHINTIDADGIALAAIQGLYQQNAELKKQVEELQVLVQKLLADQR